ncbi:MAG: GGDEF domain-containing protein [bacterium]
MHGGVRRDPVFVLPEAMYRKLAQLIRKNIDELSERWSLTLADYYPNMPQREVFRKIRALHLLFIRSLIEKNFTFLFKQLRNEFREWILLKNSFRDMMNLEPVYVMLVKEFINSGNFADEEKRELIEFVESVRTSLLRDDYNEVYVGEQEKLFSRQIDELEVLNDISATDLVGTEREIDTERTGESAHNPTELLRITLEKAMRVLGATDGVIAFNMGGSHEVAIRFADAPEQHDREIVKRITLEDSEDRFDPTVLTAFSHVVDRAVLRNYWNPEYVDDLRTQNCPSCPYRNEIQASVRGLVTCPILQTVNTNTFFCHQMGANGEKGFFLLSRNLPPAFSGEDVRFVETLASSMINIIKNYQLYMKQKELATIDGMTGLYNHRFFQEALTREISRSMRYGAPVTLLYFDIDHFKKFNDAYGHQVGDEVLKLVARTIRRNLRDSDIACRYGGEELVAILPDTPLNGGFMAAEKIRKAIESLDLPVDKKIVKITISAGVSEFPSNAHDKEKLIETADEALYYAKEGGRNQVILSFTDPTKSQDAESEEEVEQGTPADGKSPDPQTQPTETQSVEPVTEGNW